MNAAIARISTNPKHKLHVDNLLNFATPDDAVTQTLERVNVNDVEPIREEEYQRLVKPLKLKKLVREWDPLDAGWIIVSRRSDGTMHVVDGQHRVLATQQLQGKFGPFLDAIVVEGWTVVEEARFFRRTQDPANRAALMPQDTHRAGVIEGDPRALRVQGVLERTGWQIGDRRRLHPDLGHIKAASAVYSVYDKYGIGVLHHALVLIRDAWGAQRSPDSGIVLGAALFFAMYPHVNPAEVAKRTQRTPMKSWLTMAKNTAHDQRLTQTEGVAYTLRQDYNFNRLQKNKLADFADTLNDHRVAMRSEASLAVHARRGHKVSK